LIIKTIINENKIKKVILIARGPIYLEGTTIYGKPITDYVLTKEQLRDTLQSTVNILAEAGKSVYILTEVPELGSEYNLSFARPLVGKASYEPITKSIALERMKDYLDVLYSLDNVKIINTIDIFCPDEHCLLELDSGVPVYVDDNHLTVGGSYFQAEAIKERHLFP
jgi:hypothetical protein